MNLFPIQSPTPQAPAAAAADSSFHQVLAAAIGTHSQITLDLVHVGPVTNQHLCPPSGPTALPFIWCE